jgi:hypothetical protein
MITIDGDIQFEFIGDGDSKPSVFARSSRQLAIGSGVFFDQPFLPMLASAL